MIKDNNICAIIEARMTEIFHLVKSELKKFDKENQLNFGVVITGGGSKLQNVEDLALEIFGLEIKKGKTNNSLRNRKHAFINKVNQKK